MADILPFSATIVIRSRIGFSSALTATTRILRITSCLGRLPRVRHGPWFILLFNAFRSAGRHLARGLTPDQEGLFIRTRMIVYK